MNGTVATCLAIAVAVGATARPARADFVPLPMPGWANVVVAVAGSLLSGGGDGSPDLERAKQEIIAAVNGAKQEILDHIDDIANADVRACTEAATIQVAQIDAMDPFSLALFVDGAVRCATLSTAYFDAVQHLPSADNIGMLMGEIYSIAMVGFAKLGLPVTDLVDRLIRGYEAVVVRLQGQCTHRWEKDDSPRHIYPVYVTCTVYQGKMGMDTRLIGWLPGRPEPSVPYDRALQRLDAQTSRGVAIEALPRLRALRG